MFRLVFSAIKQVMASAVVGGLVISASLSLVVYTFMDDVARSFRCRSASLQTGAIMRSGFRLCRDDAVVEQAGKVRISAQYALF